jgi:hypothetical protein
VQTRPQTLSTRHDPVGSRPAAPKGGTADSRVQAAECWGYGGFLNVRLSGSAELVSEPLVHAVPVDYGLVSDALASSIPDGNEQGEAQSSHPINLYRSAKRR